MRYHSFAIPLVLSALVAGSPVTTGGCHLRDFCSTKLTDDEYYDSEDLCKGPTLVTSTEWIGASQNVKLEHITCSVTADSHVIENGAILHTRQAAPNVCGANCNFWCLQSRLFTH